MLALEIEYLSGVVFAATGPDSVLPDWPPQPDRVFSALVATWAGRGEQPYEAAALEWLEMLPPPRIEASEAVARTPATVFVPPNDPTSSKAKHASGVLPSLRGRQPRRFPASRPFDPIVRIVWPDAEPERSTFDALARLAHDTAYVGHSASLTRCRFTMRDADRATGGTTAPARRRVYPGRFQELRRSFERGLRPEPGAPAGERTPVVTTTGSIFARRGWLLLEHVGEAAPDLRASALVAKAIRDTILSGYARSGEGDAIPEIVSGHRSDGSPTRDPHLAIVPMPFVGFPHADGRLLGFAIIPPDGMRLLDDENFLRALRAVAPLDETLGRRVIQVASREGTNSGNAFSVFLSPTTESPKQSLEPRHYTRASRDFGTVTPIVLDRHLKAKGTERDREVAEQIAAACTNIGLREPEVVIANKHSAIEGAPSAYGSGKSPGWTGWRLPQSLSTRQLTHATIRFAEPVRGPVLLGAGRFVGLGLCRPLRGGGRHDSRA